jgi:flagellar basal body rod protein FlgB
MAGNIAHADIKGTTRMEMRTFEQVLKRHGAIPNKNNTQVRVLNIGASDFTTTKTEISREMEILEMSRNALEHDAILSTVKNFHQLVKTILNMSQGG